MEDEDFVNRHLKNVKKHLKKADEIRNDNYSQTTLDMAMDIINKTRVVNLRKENYDVYIGRAGKGKDGYFGNPIKLKPGDPRGKTISEYRLYFNLRITTDPEFKKRVHELKGKTLGCFCKPNTCHGDVIADYLNQL